MTDKVSAGQKLSASPLRKASVINDVMDTVAYVKQQQMGGGGDTIRGHRQTDIVKVRNDSGGDLVAGRVLQLGGYLLDEMDRRNIWFEADTPTDEERFAILGEPIKSGEIGIAHVSGVCIAVVDVTDIEHTRATPENGETVLKSGGDGPIRILSELTETGEQEVAVLIDFAGPSRFHFTLTEDMGATNANTASCTIYTADGTTRTEFATGQTLYDPDGFLDGAVSGASGPCLRDAGKYYAFNASCGS